MTVSGSGGVISAPNGVSGLLAVLPKPALLQAAFLQRPFSTCFPSWLLLLFFPSPMGFAGGCVPVSAWHLNSLILINSLEGGCRCSS